MAQPSNARRAFTGLFLLGVGSFALLLGLLWWQGPQWARGVWLACQSAVQAVEGYLPLIGLVLPISLVLFGTMRGLDTFFWQLWSTHLLLRDLRQREVVPAPALQQLFASLALPNRVRLVKDTSAFAFAAGLWRPSIWLSQGMVDLLSGEELAAVLRHERHHVQQRDPLRVLLARTLAASLFFLPVASALLHVFLDAKENEADEAAGAAPDLAAALLKLVRAGTSFPARAGLVAMDSSPTVGRIQRLLRGENWQQSLRAATGGRFFASLALVATIFATSIVSLSHTAHPITGGECGYTTSSASIELNISPATYTPAISLEQVP